MEFGRARSAIGKESVINRRDAMVWVLSVGAACLRRSQAKTLARLLQFGVRNRIIWQSGPKVSTTNRPWMVGFKAVVNLPGYVASDCTGEWFLSPQRPKRAAAVLCVPDTLSDVTTAPRGSCRRQAGDDTAVACGRQDRASEKGRGGFSVCRKSNSNQQCTAHFRAFTTGQSGRGIRSR